MIVPASTSDYKRQIRQSAVTSARNLFYQALREGASVSKACSQAGFARNTAYMWRDEDPEFRAAWDDAIESGTDKLEDEAFRRAHGFDTPVVYQGQFGKEDDFAYRKRLLEYGGNDPDLAQKLPSIAGINLDFLGQEVGLPRGILTVRDHSDTMMSIMLKARRPEVYRERTSTEVTMANGTPLIQQTLNIIQQKDPVGSMRAYQDLIEGDG